MMGQASCSLQRHRLTLTLTTTLTPLTFTVEAPAGFVTVASSYGRGDWPMVQFFTERGGLPVIPWYAHINATRPWDTFTQGGA